MLLAWLFEGYLLPAEEGEMLNKAVMIMTADWPWQVLVVVFTDDEREWRAKCRAIEKVQQHPWVIKNPTQPVYAGIYLCGEA